MEKKIWAGLILGAMMLGALGTATATTITVDTSATSPLSLAHSEAYMWGVPSSTWDSLANPITSASITLTDIWDDNNSGFENDQLALFLLDDAFMKSRTNPWYRFTDNAVIDPTGSADNSFVKSDNSSNLFLKKSLS